MEFIKSLFESKENKTVRKLLSVTEKQFKKGFYTIELDYIGDGLCTRNCGLKFEVVNGNTIMNLVFSEYQPSRVPQELKYEKVSVQSSNDDIEIIFEEKRLRLNKDLLKKLMDKFEMILTEYQEDQVTRYSQFIKELLTGNYSTTERTLGSEGIEEGKELILSTNQGIHLKFTREAHGLLIKVQDSEQIYLRALEYSMEKETFANAKIRKLNITANEKEQLLSFIKKYIDSKSITKLYTEEELLLSKINA